MRKPADNISDFCKHFARIAAHHGRTHGNPLPVPLGLTPEPAVVCECDVVPMLDRYVRATSLCAPGLFDEDGAAPHSVLSEQVLRLLAALYIASTLEVCAHNLLRRHGSETARVSRTRELYRRVPFPVVLSHPAGQDRCLDIDPGAARAAHAAAGLAGLDQAFGFEASASNSLGPSLAFGALPNLRDINTYSVSIYEMMFPVAERFGRDLQSWARFELGVAAVQEIRRELYGLLSIFASSWPLWAEIIEREPDPDVVTDAVTRWRMEQLQLPWRVLHRETGIEMLLVPDGRFRMGNGGGLPPANTCSVEVPAPFYLGRYPVTHGEWQRSGEERMGHFSRAPDSARRPVSDVPHFRAALFAARFGMRLPTEVEWEYACRAGVGSDYYNGSEAGDPSIDALAWFLGNSGGETRPVGRKLANRWGFHDMLGNVSEWVHPPPRDQAVANPPLVVLRGGSYLSSPHDVTSTARVEFEPWSDFPGGHVGFRVVRPV